MTSSNLQDFSFYLSLLKEVLKFPEILFLTLFYPPQYINYTLHTSAYHIYSSCSICLDLCISHPTESITLVVLCSLLIQHLKNRFLSYMWNLIFSPVFLIFTLGVTIQLPMVEAYSF